MTAAARGARVVARLYQAFGAVAVLGAVWLAVRQTPQGLRDLGPALVFVVGLGILCFVLAAGLLRGRAWALAACPASLRGPVAAPVPSRRPARPAVWVLRVLCFYAALIGVGIPGGMMVGEVSAGEAMVIAPIAGVLAIVFFVAARRLDR